MLSDRTITILGDIQNNIDLARRFVFGLDYDSFAHDTKTVYAVVRCLEIISEASRRLPKDLVERHPGVPWSEIAGAGNVYRHNYDGLTTRRLWDTVRYALDALDDVVRCELAQQ